jgi:hypothetical protein
MMAAALHGSPLATLDADICPSRDPGNLARLAAALQEMDAKRRFEDEMGFGDGGLVTATFDCSPEFLGRQRFLLLLTRFGELDLVFEPAGTTGYEDLASRAAEVTLGSARVQVARLEDVIHSKELANRPKDQRTLPLLRTLLETIQRRAKGEPDRS